MASTIRIKKRAASGSDGAPSSLASSELAFNESDLKLYYGFGDGGSADASSIIAIGGSGAFCALTGTQTVAGAKTFSSAATFSDNVTVTGNLTVNGTTTSIQTTNQIVKDALIELGNGTSGSPSNDAGIVIERGSSNNAFIGWDESADKFIVGTGTFTGAVTGNVTGNTSGSSGSCTGNAATATALANGRTIAMTGDVAWTSASFDGTGNVTGAGTIQSGAVETGMIAADAITNAKIADDQIDSEHYVDGSIDTAHLAADAVTGAKIADDALDSEHYTDGSIDAAHLASSSVTTAKIAGDAITAAKIADDVINSEHYAAGSIDLEHMSSESVDEDNLYISNSGSNGQFLQKQSGNSGGLTWADASAATITVADESSDTSCFPLFATAASGSSLGVKSGSNLTFNSSSGLLTATQVDGLIDGGTF